MATIFSNEPIILGSDEADLIVYNSESGTGFSWMEGGAGNDRYVIQWLSNPFDVRVAEAFGPAGGIDTVELFGYSSGNSFIALDDLAADSNTLEHLLVTDQGGAQRQILGNDLANSLSTDGIFSDQLDGGAGADTMAGGEGNDIYYVDRSSDVIVELGEGGSNDWVVSGATYILPAEVEGLELASSLSTANLNGTGNALNNVIFGNSGNNVLSALAGNDQVGGEGGNDTLLGGDGEDELNGNDGNDSVLGGAGNDEVFGGDGNDVVNGEAGDDYAAGEGGDDTLLGGAGNDYLDGGEGDGQVDVLNGGAGDDYYVVGGSDYGEGGEIDQVVEAAGGGSDTVVSRQNYVLPANVEMLLLGFESGAETGTGNAGNNHIFGNDSDNVLSGLAGNDVLDGGDGNDTMAGGAGNDRYIVDSEDDVVEEAAGQGTDHVFATLSFYTLLGTNLENLTIGNGESVVAIGNASGNLIVSTRFETSDELRGLGGNDTLDGGGSGDDSLYGGDGSDLYVMRGGEGIAVELANAGVDTVRSDSDYRLGNNIEHGELFGSNDAELIGNELANRLTGNSGDNFLWGRGGADTMAGGAGHDTYIVEAGDAPIVEAANAGHDTVRAAVTHVLAANVEDLVLVAMAGTANGTGNALDNEILGNSANNRLDGGGGNDDVYGGAGDDTLLGGAGNDWLDGGRGADQMQGGVGNDSYVVNHASDEANETVAGGGIDTAFASVTYALNSGGRTQVEHLALTGNAGNGTGNGLGNLITGNVLNNVLTGLGGNDTLDGGAGDDTLHGDAGNDTYIIDSVGDVLFEVGGGIDTVLLTFDGEGGGYSIGASDVDNLTATGDFAFAYLEGNQAFGNVITGNANNDSLLGHGGNDTLIGAAGNDTLDGGSETDSMVGGAGNDTYFVDAPADKVTEAANDGYDAVRVSLAAGQTWVAGANVEEITTTDSEGTVAFNLTGNAVDNWLIGNDGNNTISGLGGHDVVGAEGGNDSLLGGDGNDYLWGQEGDDTIDGGAGDDSLDGDIGADVMRGGAGNDYYYVDSAGDVVNETIAGSAGIDTVEVTSGEGFNVYSLGNNIENAVYNNSNLVTTTINGNALGNSIEFEGNQLVTTTISTEGGNDTVTGTQTIATGAAITLNGGANTDTLNLTLGAGFYGSLSAAGFEAINLNVTGAATWTPDAAVTTAAFRLTGAGNLTLDDVGIGSSFTFANRGGGTLLNIADAGALNDVATIVLEGNNDVDLTAAGAEILDIDVASGANAVNIASMGATQVQVTGEGSLDLELANNAIVSMADYSGVELELIGTAGDNHTVNVDNSHTSLLLSGEGGFNQIVLNTGGATGASDLRVTGGVTTLILVGDVSDILRLNVAGASTVEAGEFVGDLLLTVSEGGITFNAGDSVDWLRLVGGGNDTLNYTSAGELDELDRIEDGNSGDFDVLNANLTGFQSALSVYNIETLNFNINDNLPVFVDAQDIGSDGSFTINLGGGEGTAVTLENLQGNLNAAGFSGSVQAFAVTRDGGATNYNLRGSSGSDVILSENLLGDTLNGGGGSDVLSGGDGADRFVFDSALGIGNVDTIQDFEAGVDKIMLDQSIFASVTDGGGGTLLAGQFVYGDGGGALAADDRIIYDQVNGVLYYDSDGGTNVNRVQFAQVGGGDFGVPVLTAADFLVQP